VDPKVSIWIIKSLLILALLYLAYVDWRTFRLPNAITFPLIIFGISFNWISDLRFVSLPFAALGAILGYGSIWVLNVGYRLLKHRNGIGMPAHTASFPVYGEFSLAHPFLAGNLCEKAAGNRFFVLAEDAHAGAECALCV
jgi:prepilin signal peptidase PulO-like enzyme (type II secretory pathway)